jgi:hypothetical protein
LNSIVTARRAQLSQPAGITITALWLPKNSQLRAASGSAEVLSCTVQIGGYLRCVPGKGQLNSVRRSHARRR